MHVGTGAEHQWKAWAVAAVVAVIGLVATLFATQLTQETVAARQQSDFENRFHQSTHALTDRLLAAQNAIRGMQALFSVSDVKREDFNTFVQVATEGDSVQALEFIRHVPSSERLLFEAEVRNDRSLVPGGYPAFAVSPETEHPDMFVVDYVEPMEGNEPAFGFDLGTNEARRRAIEHARDTGEMVASQTVELVQDDGSRPGFLLMLPVYDDGVDPSSVAIRRTSFEGVVAGVFVLEELLAGASGFDTSLSFRVRDLGHTGQPELPTELFATPGFDVESEILSQPIIVGDRQWSIDATDSRLSPPLTDSLPTAVLATGVVLTIAVMFAAASVLGSRDRAEAAAAEATADLTVQAEQLRAARDKAREADRLKSTFLANMSHELRTPLNGVIGLSSVLVNQGFGPLNEKQLQHVEQIQASGDHLLQLIDDLLDLARIEAGREHLHVEAVHLEDAISSALDTVRVHAITKGIELHAPGDFRSVAVKADKRKLHQVLLNLLSNAVKFTEEGGSVGVDVTIADEAAALEVWDTGIGIPSDEIGNLFTPFHQVDSRVARAQAGTGLGLALTKDLVEIHGGTITVSSVEGTGSRFAVSWPLDASLDAAEEVAEEPIVADLGGLQVVVAEDSTVNRMVIADMLAGAGCAEIWEATTGREAVSLARSKQPHLILLDIQLPELDGLAVARILKSDPEMAETRILAVTAQALPEEVERIREAGIDGYLAKPFKQAEFVNAVHSVVGALADA